MSTSNRQSARAWKAGAVALAASLLLATTGVRCQHRRQQLRRARARRIRPRTDAQIVAQAAKAMIPDVNVGELAPEVKTMFRFDGDAVDGLSSRRFWDKCISEPICDTGQGGAKTVAMIFDQVTPLHGDQRAARALATAIQSGDVKKGSFTRPPTSSCHRSWRPFGRRSVSRWT